MIDEETVELTDTQLDMWVVAFDETEYWTMPEEWKPYVLRLGTTYAFDRNRHVYACEMTPSYELFPIEPQTLFTEAFYELEDFERDRLQDEIDQEQHKYIDWSVKYVHVYTLDALIANPGPYQVSDEGIEDLSNFADIEDLDSREDAYLEFMENYVQACRENTVL